MTEQILNTAWQNLQATLNTLELLPDDIDLGCAKTDIERAMADIEEEAKRQQSQ